MKSFSTAALLITMLVATVNSIPRYDEGELMDSQSLIERVMNLLTAEERAEAKVIHDNNGKFVLYKERLAYQTF